MVIKNTIEILFILALFINAVLFIPQVVRLYQFKDAKGLSFITFFGFNLIQIATALHGYFRKDYLLFFGTLLSIITCGAVTVLIVVYRLKQG